MSIKKEILKSINEELTTEPLTPKEEDSGINGMRLFTFETENAEYGVTFKKDPNENAYDVIFGSFDENGVLDTSETNFGEAPVVFSTVNKIVEDFLSSVKPDVLDFVAIGTSYSRLSIYKRFAKRIASNFPEYESRSVYNIMTGEKKERKIALVKKEWLEQNKGRQVKEERMMVSKILKEIILEEVLEEAEYQGKKVTLNDPFRTPSGPKKYSVYVKNDNVAAVGAIALSLANDSTSTTAFIDHNGVTGKALYIDAESTTQTDGMNGREFII